MKMTNNLHKVILGLLLADGYVERTGRNCRLSFSFGTPYLDYANWLHNLFSDYCSNGVYPVQSRIKDRMYVNYRLKTKTLSEFNVYRTMFYISNEKGYRKIVPISIKEDMCYIVLAHLIIGDGNFTAYDIRTRIYTNHFSFDECRLLADAITTNCNIRWEVLYDRVSKSGIKQYILTIGKSQLEKLRAHVAPHMHQSMLYKVGKIFPPQLIKKRLY